MPLGTEVGLGPGHIVLVGDPAPPPRKGTAPQFSAHIYCGQTAGWMKMPRLTKVGIRPGHIVLDGEPAPPPKGGTSLPLPIFSSYLLSPTLWVDQDDTWYEGRPRPREHCVRWDPDPPKRGISTSPIFGPCQLYPNVRTS